MEPVDYLNKIQVILGDQTQNEQEKFDSIINLFRKDLAALMYFPERWLKAYPATVQALREDLRRGFSKIVNYNGD
jgi:hypothetical protein